MAEDKVKIEPEKNMDAIQELADKQDSADKQESTEKDTEKKPNSYSEKVGRK